MVAMLGSAWQWHRLGATRASSGFSASGSASSVAIEGPRAVMRLARECGVHHVELEQLPGQPDDPDGNRLRVVVVGGAEAITAFGASLSTSPRTCRVESLTLAEVGEELSAEALLVVFGDVAFEARLASLGLVEALANETPAPEELALPAISKIQFSRGTAVLNGRLCQAGSRIGDWAVEAVLPDSVVLTRGETRVELVLPDDPEAIQGKVNASDSEQFGSAESAGVASAVEADSPDGDRVDSAERGAAVDAPAASS